MSDKRVQPQNVERTVITGRFWEAGSQNVPTCILFIIGLLSNVLCAWALEMRK